MIRFLAPFILIFFGGFFAQARIFNINDESFGAYLRGSFAPLQFKNTLNSDSKGAGVTLDSEEPYIEGGEFGLVYGSRLLNFRFGLELVHPPDRADITGRNSSDVAMYNLTSETSVVIPKIGVEVNLKRWSRSRLFVGGGYGYATLIGRNSYSMTTAGAAQLHTQDFYEDLRGTTSLFEGLLGFEGVVTDTMTWVVEAGYRSLDFTTITHNRDTATFQGTVSKGDVARNMDGTPRTLDMSAGYLSLALRFWIH